jgi:transglutaminase-like putative cysteine protease
MSQGSPSLSTRCGLAALLVAAAAFGFAAFAHAQESPSATPPSQGDTASAITTFDFTITVRADRTAEKIETRRIKVLAAGAVQSVGQQTLTYVEDMQTVDILDAYTEKADGRRVAVEPDRIMTRDAPTGSLFHLRDQKVRTVIFPDVAIGDTIVLSTRRNIASSNFPGHYYDQFLFARTFSLAESIIRIAAPKDLPLKVAVLGEGLAHETADEAETIRHVITYRPLPRLQAEAGATSAADRDPRVFVTTFKNYEEQGENYWAAAGPRIAVTEEIAALADVITKGVADRRAQAQAIDSWVKRNIRYVAIYLGTGRVVPYPAADVLKHRYGDCKDHATLMSALLAAKGIASEHVLINAGAAYTLPDPAVMLYFNHVILYLPEFGIYDDPTVSHTPFGVLSPGTYDKPVIHASAKGAYRTRTPVMRADDHTSLSRSRIAVAADGTVTGESEQISTGVFGAGLRAAAAAMESNGLEASVEQRLRALGTPGRGRFEIAPLSELPDSYTVKGRFTLNQRLSMTPGTTQTIPVGLPLQRRPGEYLFGNRHAGRAFPFVCFAGRQVEETEIRFADGLVLPLPLRGRTIEHRLFSYSSSYRLENRTFKVRREFVSRVPGQVCPPQVEDEIAEDLKAVRGSLATRMSFPASGKAAPNQQPQKNPPAMSEPAVVPSIPQPDVSATAQPPSE